MLLNRSLIIIGLLPLCLMAGISSNTDMYIAVSNIKPYVTSQMKALQQKVESIVSYYKENNHKASETRNIYFQRFMIMDKEIALALREIKMYDQELIELRKSTKE